MGHFYRNTCSGTVKVMHLAREKIPLSRSVSDPLPRYVTPRSQYVTLLMEPAPGVMRDIFYGRSLRKLTVHIEPCHAQKSIEISLLALVTRDVIYERPLLIVVTFCLRQIKCKKRRRFTLSYRNTKSLCFWFSPLFQTLRVLFVLCSVRMFGHPSPCLPFPSTHTCCCSSLLSSKKTPVLLFLMSCLQCIPSKWPAKPLKKRTTAFFTFSAFHRLYATRFLIMVVSCWSFLGVGFSSLHTIVVPIHTDTHTHTHTYCTT